MTPPQPTLWIPQWVNRQELLKPPSSIRYVNIKAHIDPVDKTGLEPMYSQAALDAAVAAALAAVK